MSTETPSFEEAMNISMHWCNAWENGELSDEVLADRVAKLLNTKYGLRGFFVTTLASDCPLLDRLPDALMMELRSGGEKVIDITVRNLAMSTAMAVVHSRNSNKVLQITSERITARCIEILRLLEPNAVKKRLETLLSATNGKGEDDILFLQKWKYDHVQKLAIAKSIKSVAN